MTAKSIFAALLVAAMAAGAQAVTARWTQSGTLSAKGSASLTSVAGKSFSVALVFDLSTLPEAGTNLLSAKGSAVSSTGTHPAELRLQTCAATENGSNVQGLTPSWEEVPGVNKFGTLREGTNVIGIIFKVSTSGLVADFYVNGTFCDSGRPMWGESYVNFKVSDLTAGVDGTWYAGEGIATAEDFDSLVSLPEPTVLALLAVGVAGLALRRKVA